MSGWFVEIEFTGTLRREQMEQAAEGAFLAQYSEGTKVLRLRHGLDAIEYDDALAEAKAWVTGLRAVTEFVPAGVLNGPDRFVVETSASAARQWVLLGAAEAAGRLGVSTSRLRQLEERPDFPDPVLTLAGGRVYRVEDIDEFNQAWDRRPGRPPRQ